MLYQPGEILLGKYRIEALLGKGAFGEVYRVTHISLKVPRAIKVLRRDAPGVGSAEFNDGQARFQLEAQLGARLNSPNSNPRLLQVHDFSRTNDILVLEMEYAPGGSLLDRIQKAGESGDIIPVTDALQITADVAAGLEALQALDIVHRDLKPANILFDQHGNARLADLGLAQIPNSIRSQVSNPPPHPGTPGYMSPEQNTSTNYLTPASDVFALGLILFEMLTGRIYQSQKPGTKASDFRADIPAWVENLLEQMLEEDPKKRPWGGKEVARLINDSLKADVVILPPAQPAVDAAQENMLLRPMTKQKRWQVIWIGVATMLVIVTLLGLSSAVGRFFGTTEPTGPASITLQKGSPATSNQTQAMQASFTNTPATVIAPTRSPTFSPNQVKTPTPTPKAGPSNTITPSPTYTQPSCAIQRCQSDAGDVCVYSFAPQSTSLIVALKFKNPVNPAALPQLLVGKYPFSCESISSYPDRVYCSGKPLFGNLLLELFSAKNELVCSGSLPVPRYVTPVASPTKKDRSIPGYP